MSEKTLRMMVIMVGVLVAAYAVTALVTRGPVEETGAEGRALVAALRQAGRMEPEAVRITAPAGDTVLLAGAEGGGWAANGKPADSAAVARLLDALDGARVGRVAAANPDNHTRLGVAADSTWRLELRRREDAPVVVLVGNSGPGAGSVYARLPDAAEVYEVQGELGPAVRRGADEWRDRVMLRLDAAGIAQLAVTREGESYALVREPPATDSAAARWTVDGSPADSTAVQELLSELARLEAQAFVPDSVTAGGTVRSVVVLGAAGDTLAEIRLSATDETWTFHALARGKAVRAGQDDVPFELASWRADRLVPARERVGGGG